MTMPRYNPYAQCLSAGAATSVRDWNPLLSASLTKPFSWRKPRRVFVNSMSDLFHPDVPFDYIDRVFAVMALTPDHTYQVLTKRPDRMAEFLNEGSFERGYASVLDEIEELANEKFGDIYKSAHEHKTIRVYAVGDSGEYGCEILWPIPNVWLGTSVEDQRTADERIPHLLRCPAAVRFLSCEPLLGPVDLTYIDESIDALRGYREFAYGGGPMGSLPSYCPTFGDVISPVVVDGRCTWPDEPYPVGPRISQVIVGGESGPNARPMSPDWARSLRDQCVAAGVAFFFKQGSAANWPDYKNFESFPPELQLREFPNG